jgi:hypothetical protein
MTATTTKPTAKSTILDLPQIQTLTRRITDLRAERERLARELSTQVDSASGPSREAFAAGDFEAGRELAQTKGKNDFGLQSAIKAVDGAVVDLEQKLTTAKAEASAAVRQRLTPVKKKALLRLIAAMKEIESARLALVAVDRDYVAEAGGDDRFDKTRPR